jgi:hypothetical protein
MLVKPFFASLSCCTASIACQVEIIDVLLKVETAMDAHQMIVTVCLTIKLMFCTHFKLFHGFFDAG